MSKRQPPRPPKTTPVVFSDFCIRCAACKRLTRLGRDYLLEENAVAAALGARESLAATAKDIVYCHECATGEPLPGEHLPEPDPSEPQAADAPYFVPPRPE